MKSIVFFAVILTFLFVFSCKKDSDDKAELTPREILTSHSWKFSTLEQYSSVTDSYTIVVVSVCALDNCTAYKSDGTGNASVGTVKCDPNETDKTFTWTMSQDGQITGAIKNKIVLNLPKT